MLSVNGQKNNKQEPLFLLRFFTDIQRQWAIQWKINTDTKHRGLIDPERNAAVCRLCRASTDSAQLVGELQDDKRDGVDSGISIKDEALDPDLFEQFTDTEILKELLHCSR